MTSPFFSIIVPLYNKEKHIKNTLKSVINQTFTNFEVIVVNDGSTDNSAEIVNFLGDGRIKLINKKNEGVSIARNTGIETASAPYIALLDADDLWNPNFLSTIYNTIQAYPNQSIFSAAISFKYRNKTVPAQYCFKKSSEPMVLDYFKNSLNQPILHSSSSVFQKDILYKIGFFDRKLTTGEDTDMWIRMGIHYPIVFISDILVSYLYDYKSLSNTNFDLEGKPKFDKFKIEELDNSHLKKLLDRNRFSMAILSKLQNNNDRFRFYKNDISLKNLKAQQRILLFAPRNILKLLLYIKSMKGIKLYYKPLKDKNSL